jgi:hypothetical protein
MVVLPKEFVATKYPGYFWNTATQELCSVKITGTLKPLKFTERNRWQHFDGYKVSVNGEHRYLAVDYLKKLKPAKTEFPVWSQP